MVDPERVPLVPVTARTLMIQGTASSVGKSIVTAALCRLFRQEGLRVAPFKAQNMALNAAVTAHGMEIGRAQAVQAEAARIDPTVDMNPILVKPEGDSCAQVVVMGKPIGRLRAAEYQALKPELREVVRASLDRLRAAYDLVLIEGAGSPAEINLKDRDLVNMFVAGAADAPVVLVGDIDRGGVFAAFVGTLELLEPHERDRVAALLVNKFRGDRKLLDSGIDFLETRTQKPVLGVLPFVQRLRVADEDSLALDERRGRAAPPGADVDVAVVRVPRISNHDEFQPLEQEPGVSLRFVERPEELAGADLVVLPGSKATANDLRWLRTSGLAEALAARALAGERVLGICGGCQMLGLEILDPEGVESDEPRAEGLGLLPARTRFGREKRTTQVRARAATASFLGGGGELVSGYEIHMGRLERAAGARPAFAVHDRNGRPEQDEDGVVSTAGNVVGTMIHGLLEDAGVRRALLASLRERRPLVSPALAPSSAPAADEYDRLAEVVRAHVRMDLLWKLVGR